MATFISRSPEQTQSLGEEWGRAAQAGLVIGLSGDLGAGKTQLVIGVARGLGIAGRISSPTFTLVHEYRTGRLPLFHLDLYRLETSAQILGAGLEEYLDRPAGVSVVEWSERWFDAINSLKQPARYRSVRIEIHNETERRIIYEDFGS
jgi:tRNA threonylcarbamoyladenosine biosynthesis protein TsaE